MSRAEQWQMRVLGAWARTHRTARRVRERAKTPLGRRLLIRGVVGRSRPILDPLARRIRRTLGRRTNLVAVVGTYGKTTTTRAVRAVLGLDFRRHKGWNSGSFVALEVLRLASRPRDAVLEVAITARDQMRAYADMLCPDVVVVTSIGSEHHRSFGTLECTREQKADMVRTLPSSGLAVLNGDDPNVVWMRTQTDAQVVTFGFGRTCDVRGCDVRLLPEGRTVFRVETPSGTRTVSTRLVGKTMVYPLLAAITVAINRRVSLDDALDRLADLPPTPERMQPIMSPDRALLLLDTFKAGSETIEAALDALDTIPASRRLVVLGEIEEPLGPQNAAYRSLGRRVASTAEMVIYVGGRKTFSPLAAGAVDGGLSRDRILHGGRAPLAVVDLLRSEIRPGDVILLKGRSVQRLGRIGLAMAGRNVRCGVIRCSEKTEGCESCVMLERSRSSRVHREYAG